ncbi:FecR domain-containing protein, partial [Arenibacter sp. ARW7G5Y1]|uniref:FecR domain-containing protein n=1 Tax=Arenibacter sp. ARW7G5Y1 TaxID=2135619 RepID=UPI000D930B74
MKDIFHISRLVIKRKLKVLTDSEKQQLKQFHQDYPFLKDVDIEALADRLSRYSSVDKEKGWKAIVLKSIEKTNRPRIRLLKNSWFKYVTAAAVASLIAMAYFYKNRAFDHAETAPTVVNIKTIEPGADKATLSLENGSTVILEKGSMYQTQNAKSNGEQIVYEGTAEKPSKVVYNYLTVPRGGQFFLELSDNTKVWLNSESRLKYPVQFIENETRQVELVYGEAYFDVSPSTEHGGTKFKVLNLSQEVEVIGTEFNIKAYSDETMVYTTLAEGKVVVGNDNFKQPLLPG